MGTEKSAQKAAKITKASGNLPVVPDGELDAA
jgi:hypothetical protein